MGRPRAVGAQASGAPPPAALCAPRPAMRSLTSSFSSTAENFAGTQQGFGAEPVWPTRRHRSTSELLGQRNKAGLFQSPAVVLPEALPAMSCRGFRRAVGVPRTQATPAATRLAQAMVHPAKYAEPQSFATSLVQLGGRQDEGLSAIGTTQPLLGRRLTGRQTQPLRLQQDHSPAGQPEAAHPLPSLPPAWSRPLVSTATLSSSLVTTLRATSPSPDRRSTSPVVSDWTASPTGSPTSRSQSPRAFGTGTLTLRRLSKTLLAATDPLLRVVPLSHWLLAHGLVQPLTTSTGPSNCSFDDMARATVDTDITNFRPSTGSMLIKGKSFGQGSLSGSMRPGSSDGLSRAYVERLAQMAQERGLTLAEADEDLQIFRLVLHSRQARRRMIDLGLWRSWLRPGADTHGIGGRADADADTAGKAGKGKKGQGDQSLAGSAAGGHVGSGSGGAGGLDGGAGAGGGGAAGKMSKGELEEEERKRREAAARAATAAAAGSGGAGGGGGEQGEVLAGGGKTPKGGAGKEVEEEKPQEKDKAEEHEEGDAEGADVAEARRRMNFGAGGTRSGAASPSGATGAGATAGGGDADEELARRRKDDDEPWERGALFKVKKGVSQAETDFPDGVLLPVPPQGVHGRGEDEDEDESPPVTWMPLSSVRGGLAEEFRQAIKEAWAKILLEAVLSPRAAPYMAAGGTASRTSERREAVEDVVGASPTITRTVHYEGGADGQGDLEEDGSMRSRRSRYGRRLQAQANTAVAGSRSRQRWLQRVESCKRSLGALEAVGAFADRQGVDKSWALTTF